METQTEPQPKPPHDLSNLEVDEQVRLLSEVTQDLIWDWDVRKNRVHYNAHWVDALGEAPEEYEASRQWWKTRAHPDDVERVTRIYDEAIAEGHAGLSFEYRILGADGKFLALDSRVSFIHGADGQLVRVLIASRDISKRRRAEEAQQRLTRILEATT